MRYNCGTMRILITADLHYNIPRSREPARRLARQVLATGGDALVLVGDTAAADVDQLRRCLHLFENFRGSKFLVPGNHCLWCRDGETSLDRYQRVLPAEAERAGFSVLDHHPAVFQHTALVGSVGWYDYSLADPSLEIPEAFYRAKVAPGAAAWLGQDRLVRAHRHALTDRQMALGVRWMDGCHVRLTMSDGAFADALADKLTRQLLAVSPRVQRIVAFVHHLVLRQQVPPGRPDRFAFAAAYMGAERFGQILLACDKVSHVYCGHSHWPDRRTVGNVTVVSIGSTYVQKRLEILEL